MEKNEKLTREDLRGMRIGETRTFKLPSALACDSAKATVYQMQNIERVRYSLQTDYENNTLTITKNSI